MMRFCKSGYDVEDREMERQWDGAFNGYYLDAHLKLMALQMESMVCAAGHSALTITDIFRAFYKITKFRKGTFHWIGQALDFRIRPWKNKLRDAIDKLLEAYKEIWPQLQWVWEKDHLHVEWDDGNEIVKGRRKRTVH